VTGTGRSPDFRVIAFFRLPERTNAFSGTVEEAQRLQLRGQSRIWPCDLTVFPFHPPLGGTDSEADATQAMSTLSIKFDQQKKKNFQFQIDIEKTA
jgi:hypothetical protein